ncbi:hypothetical protein UT300012_22820 [Paraclostridium bifermentans]
MIWNFICYKLDSFKFYPRVDKITGQMILLVPLVLFLYEDYFKASISLGICLLLFLVTYMGFKGRILRNCMVEYEIEQGSIVDQYVEFCDTLDKIEPSTIVRERNIDTSSMAVRNYIKYAVFNKGREMLLYAYPVYILITSIILISMFPQVREAFKVLVSSIGFGIVFVAPVIGIIIARHRYGERYENFSGSFDEFEDYELRRQFNAGEISAEIYDKYSKLERKS